MRPDIRTFVAEPEGLIGSAIVRALGRRGGKANLIPSAGLDLAGSGSVDAFFARHRPERVFLAAGKKGGILANQRYPADLMLDNLRVATHVLAAARRWGTGKLLYLGSACVYPRDCPQPMEERMLLSGPFEPTSEAYSVAKLAGLKLCQAVRRQDGCGFITAIPTNIFGPYDDFDPETAHVVAALIRRMHTAKREGQREVVVWGTGEARREFLFSDDLADACVFLMEHYDGEEVINIGCGSDLSIRALAEAIKDAVGFRGVLRFDSSKPDGMPRKSLDCRRLTELGWRPTVSFHEGLRRTCAWYEEQCASGSPGARPAAPTMQESICQN